MNIYLALISGVIKPKHAAEVIVNYPNRRTGILIFIIYLVLNLAYSFYHNGFPISWSKVLIDNILGLSFVLLLYGILRLLRGNGSFMVFLSTNGWLGIVGIVMVMVMFVREAVSHNLKTDGSVISQVLSLILYILSFYFFIMSIIINSISMKVTRKKAFWAYVISYIPILTIISSITIPLSLAFNKESAYYSQGMQDYQAGYYDKAFAEFNQGLSVSPKNPRQSSIEFAREVSDINHKILNGKGLTLNALNKPQEAITTFTQSISLNPNDGKVYYNRGLSELSLGNYIKAAADFDNAISLNPQDKESYYSKGIMFTNQGKLNEARDMFNHALKIDPKYNEALLALKSLN